jgi:hypothetical protein
VKGEYDLQVRNYSTELLTSRNGVAGVVFRLWLKDTGYETRQKENIFLFCKMSRMSLGSTYPPIPMETEGFSGRQVARG